jgi:hypothetical protein
MGDHPEEDKVAVEFSQEHGLKVELEERLAGEGLVIAQDAEAVSVGNDRPEVRLAAVQELLDESVRISTSSSAYTG